MTKKDYEAIAEAIRIRRGCFFPENPDLADGTGETIRATQEDLMFQVEQDLSNLMAADNPRFDRTRFLAACRGEDSVDSAGRKVRYSATVAP